MPESIFPLQCGAQSYDWGKIGETSTVAQFVHNTNPSFAIQSDKPYAELWMGTHPSVPSKCQGQSNNGKSLAESVQSDPDFYLSKPVIDKFGAQSIPYLFKVLSINKALSIQAHPDKALAKQLFQRDPKNYPDDNHKPEMAIAITDFEGLCGFRPLKEIAHYLEVVAPFAEIVGPEATQSITQAASAAQCSESDAKSALKAVFSRLMNCEAATIEAKAQELVSLCSGSSSAQFDSTLCPILLRLNKQFPNDIGLFCCLMLNYVTLTPGEAMYLQAKDPHAYISGDIIECMAASDNVVRAGFTPKFKDVDTLVNMLTYSYAPVAEQKMKPEQFPRASGSDPNARFVLYNPPIDEFSVLESTVPANSTATHKGIAGPSIVVVTSGEADVSSDTNDDVDAVTGCVFFVAPNHEITIRARGGADCVSYRAFVEA